MGNFSITLDNKFDELINKNKNVTFYITLLLFLSPYFRSSAIWATTDNSGILFFLLSVLYFLKISIQNQKRTKTI